MVTLPEKIVECFQIIIYCQVCNANCKVVLVKTVAFIYEKGAASIFQQKDPLEQSKMLQLRGSSIGFVEIWKQTLPPNF